jgi:hypothetical protein
MCYTPATRQEKKEQQNQCSEVLIAASPRERQRFQRLIPPRSVCDSMRVSARRCCTEPNGRSWTPAWWSSDAHRNGLGDPDHAIEHLILGPIQDACTRQVHLNRALEKGAKLSREFRWVDVFERAERGRLLRPGRLVHDRPAIGQRHAAHLLRTSPPVGVSSRTPPRLPPHAADLPVRGDARALSRDSGRPAMMRPQPYGTGHRQLTP